MLKTAILPESYTLETGAALLKNAGFQLRQQDLAQELLADQSCYKKMLKLPALTLYNQYLIHAIQNNYEYLQAQLNDITTAVANAKIKTPEIKVLSEQRTEQFNMANNTAKQIMQEFAKAKQQHETLNNNISARLQTQLEQWQILCHNSAAQITASLTKQAIKLPNNFSDILSKHLQRAGTNKISADELKQLNIKKSLNYVEQALLCALKEVKYHE